MHHCENSEGDIFYLLNVKECVSTLGSLGHTSAACKGKFNFQPNKVQRIHWQGNEPGNEQDARLTVTLRTYSMGAGGPSTSCTIQSHIEAFLSAVVI